MKKYKLLMIILVLFSLLFVSCKTTGLISYKTIELKVIWDPNTEPDISHYNLYLVSRSGDIRKVNDNPIPHPPTIYTFTLEMADDYGSLCFVATAVDTSRNESGYSNKVCVDE